MTLTRIEAAIARAEDGSVNAEGPMGSQIWGRHMRITFPGTFAQPWRKWHIQLDEYAALREKYPTRFKNGE